MATTQDGSIGIVAESSYKTNTTVNRWFEYVDEDLDWDKTVVQGKSLRVGGRVARQGRRTVPKAQGKGSFSMEAVGKGMGLLFQAALGAGSTALVSGSTNQQLFTLGDNPTSLTLQKGVPEAGGTVDPETFLGCMVDTLELDFPNGDIVTAKSTLDIGDLTTATVYAAPSYPTPLNLFHFAGGSVSSGTLTAPTSTALATGSTSLADIRGGSVTIANNLQGDRFNMGGAGRKVKPLVGLRDIGVKLDIEYDNTTFRDAVLGETPMLVLLNFTAGSLSTGLETLQIVLPSVTFDSELPKTNGTNLIIQSMSGAVLDNLTAAQPIWIVTRTSDSSI